MIKLDLKSKKVKLIIAASAVLIIFISGYYLMQSEEVTIEKVSIQSVKEIIKDTGVVRSQSMVELVSYGNGKVVLIDVEIGQKVESGEKLGEVDSTALQYQLESLSYEVQALQTNVDYLASPYGELMVDSVEDSARIAMESYVKSKNDYENGLVLFESGAISKSELDSLELLFNVNKMSYTIALNEADSVSGSSNTNLDQYKLQLNSLEAQLKVIKSQIENHTITAPFDGVISDIYIRENNYAYIGMPVIQIYMEDYYIEASLLEDDLIQIQDDTIVNIILNNDTIKGKIKRIHPTIKTIISDLGVSQLKGTVEIATEYDFKIVGHEVNLEFVINEVENAISVDKEAIIKLSGDDYVYVVKGNKAILTSVNVGIKGTKRFEILEGLSEGDIVIINPSENIEDGIKVKSVEDIE